MPAQPGPSCTSSRIAEFPKLGQVEPVPVAAYIGQRRNAFFNENRLNLSKNAVLSRYLYMAHLALQQFTRVPHSPRVLVNINELSSRLAVAKGTLYNWVYLKRIPYIKAGRCLRFDPEEVLASLPHSTTMNLASKR